MIADIPPPEVPEAPAAGAPPPEGQPSASRAGALGPVLLGLSALVASAAMLIYVLNTAGLVGTADVPPATAVAGDAPVGEPAEGAAPVVATAPGEAAAAGETVADASAEAGGPAEAPAADGATAATEAGAAADAPPGGDAPAAAPLPSGTRVVEPWATRPGQDGAFTLNLGGAGNGLDVATPPDPAHAIRLSWRVVREAPSDFVGVDRALEPAQDWSGATALAVRATAVTSGAPAPYQFILQWREAESGEVWRHRGRLVDLVAGGMYAVPFTPDAWEWAEWSTQANGALDLGPVDYYGIYVGHAGPGEGHVDLGPLWLAP